MTSIPPLKQRQLPIRIERLRELATNLWWSWHEEAQFLYAQIDPLLWEKVYHNPVAFLRRVSETKLDQIANDIAYTAAYDKVFRTFDAYMAESDTWFATQYPRLKDSGIAYFSTEFGLHESLPLYAGGLGVLSGDHAKEASDLGLPFVGIGLLYHKGYFTQKINSEGWQEDVYDDFDPEDRPICPVLSSDGASPLHISLKFGEVHISSQLWKVQVGRVIVYLLDTLLDSSHPELTQDIPRLYGGSHLTRLLQEILLGIGGVQALTSLNIHPQVFHMNEGHSSFLTIELLKNAMKDGLSYQEAVEYVKEMSVFTTHTPVPAGLDMFDLDTIAPYFKPYCEEAGIQYQQFLDLGRQDVGWGDQFSMPRLALHLSTIRNGVSRLHGEVSRQLFKNIWPDRPVDEIPITYVTNGIHAETWLAPQMSDLFNTYIGHDWVQYMDIPELWAAIDAIPDQVLWNTRHILKLTLLQYLQDKARNRWAASETTPAHIAWSGTLFSQKALTIGFARRFATYKRATLLFKDIDRLAKLLANEERPVQIVFSGKAHPQDHGGKTLIQEICRHALNPQLAGRVAFLENYDMAVARYLIRGVDIWLNNPRRPREASGTSGQKAALNGIPNLSILDGWWAEGFNGQNGWAIGNGQGYSTEDIEDQSDAERLYAVLEQEVVPLYYDRTDDGPPHQWLDKVREAIKSAAPYFTTRRMVKEYTTRMYVPILQTENQQALT